MALFPVDPYGFSGQLGGMAGPDGLSARLNDLHYRLATVEGDIEEADLVELYIDGTSGNDANDGTSLVNAVQSIPRLKELIPEFIKSRFLVVHMSGNIAVEVGSQDSDINEEMQGTLHFNCVQPTEAAAGGKTGPVIIVDGGLARTEILGTTTSDTSAVGEVGLSTATWTPNEYRGLHCRFTSGPLSGRAFGVKYNSANNLYLVCTADPGVGSDFVLERPATTITGGNWLTHGQQDYIFGAFVNGPGLLFVQNLYIYGATLRIGSADAAKAYSKVYVAQVVLDPFGAGLGLWPDCAYGFIVGSHSRATFDGHIWDTSGGVPTFTERGDPGADIGVTCVSEPYIAGVFLYSGLGCGAYNSVLCKTAAWYCTGLFRMAYSQVSRLTFLNSPTQGHGGTKNLDNTEIGGNVVAAQTEFPALEVSYSSIDMRKCTLDYSLYGMRVIKSKVVMAKNGGTNNTHCGCWADSQSLILQPPGQDANTISGNSVELSLNGTTQVSTWAALQQIEATGDITAIAPGTPGSGVADGETFVLNDGSNPAVTFEFDTDSSVVETATLRQVDISGASTAADVADAIYVAINAAPTLDILADDPDGGTVVDLENIGGAGASGNVAITDTVVDATFVTTGMSGGQTAAPISDPELVAKEAHDIYTANWGGPGSIYP